MSEEKLTKDQILALVKKFIVNIDEDRSYTRATRNHVRGKSDLVEKKYREFINLLDSMEGDMSGNVLTALGQLSIEDQIEGDYLTNPVSAISDGYGFGTETEHISGTHLEINLGLDVSGSMTAVEYDGRNDPLYIATRQFFACLCARFIRKSIITAVEKTSASITFRSFSWAEGGGLYGSGGTVVSPYRGQVWIRHPNTGSTTPPLYLLKRLLQSEIEDGRHDAARLDLIITDGSFSPGTKKKSEPIQRRRVAAGGSLKTVILNIMNISPSYRWAFEENAPLYSTHLYVEHPKVLARVMTRVIQDFIYNNQQTR